jgi:hypoxanthine phosphoribosyltransferase
MTPTFTPFTQAEFLAAIDVLAAELTADGWAPHLLVGVGRGGLVPAVFLSHATAMPMVSIDFSTSIPEFNAALIQALAARTRTGERLVFIEDINDSGRTIVAIREQMSAAGAVEGNTRFAVLLDNLVSAAKVDHRFRTIDRTTQKDWFVFPWEAVAPRDSLLGDAAEVPTRIA